MMDPARWERIQALFHAAADLPISTQQPFLSEACAGDEGLMAAVLALLAEDARIASLLDRGVAEVARQVLAAPQSDSLPFTRIGRYAIKKWLGEGGMGVVYLAEREDLGSLVAIKVLRDAWVSPARRERFGSEQRMLARLNHPSIARIYDADTLADGSPWFAMEYVEGLPITDYCREHACVIADRLRLFREVCEAVQYAHQHLIIHRDLKPSNILVSTDRRVKLLDFGIARQLETVAPVVNQTRTMFRLMTPAYAAPEQLRGETTVIPTDVYALGVVLYELLAGRRPFDLSDRTPGQAETIICEQEPEKPSTASRTSGAVPPASRASWADLDVLCLTAMRKDPRRRYPTVEALIRDLDHYEKGEPLEARPESLRYRAGKFARRNWPPLSAAAVLIVLLIGLVTIHTIRLGAARDAALAEAARTQRVQHFMLSLFEGGQQVGAPAHDLRVLTLLDRGLQEARSLDGEPGIQAELYETLGSIFQRLGSYDQADTLLQSALDQRRTVFGEDHPDVAASLVALALLRVAQARLDEAEQLAREGLERSRRVLPADHPVRARAKVALARVERERGAYDQAIPLLEEAIRVYSASPAAAPDLSAALTSLANTHFYSGNLDASEALNRRVIELDRQLYGDTHPNVAHDLLNLSAIQHSRGEYAEAERYAREAVAILERWYGRDHPETASAMIIRGQALRFQERYDEAIELFEEALATQERVYGPAHPRVAFALNELGGAAQGGGDLDRAEAAYRRALDIYTSTYEGKHSRVGAAMSNLAGVYLAREEYARAAQLFRDAIALYSEVLPDGHLNTGIARIRLGRTLLRMAQYEEAETHLVAGYEIVTRSSRPSMVWLRMARADLATVYDALGQSDRVEQFRAELRNAP
jgi:eukaryotic-like serine/threonine-protein kinase